MSGTMEEYNYQRSGYCADQLGHDAVTCGMHAQAANHFAIVSQLTVDWLAGVSDVTVFRCVCASTDEDHCKV